MRICSRFSARSDRPLIARTPRTLAQRSRRKHPGNHKLDWYIQVYSPTRSASALCSLLILLIRNPPQPHNPASPKRKAHLRVQEQHHPLLTRHTPHIHFCPFLIPQLDARQLIPYFQYFPAFLILGGIEVRLGIGGRFGFFLLFFCLFRDGSCAFRFRL